MTSTSKQKAAKSALEARYNRWLKKTRDPVVSSILALAETIEATGAKIALPVFEVPEEEVHAPEGMFDLKAAAAYLGYQPAGLRKLAQQRLVKYSQNGRGPLRFRREWLDEFVATTMGGPEGVARRAAAPRRRKPVVEVRHGFDPALFSPRARK